MTELYLSHLNYIWVSIHHLIVFFLLHKFKMMASPDVFFFFSKFWFTRLLGGRVLKDKKLPKMTKKKFSHPIFPELYLIWLWFLLHMCKIMISPAIFFSFFQYSAFSGFSKFINKCQKEILRCVSPSSHVCDFVYKKSM